ncbi:hypothetical protein L9F63_021462, partial [Diploptera punctata]
KVCSNATLCTFAGRLDGLNVVCYKYTHNFRRTLFSSCQALTVSFPGTYKKSLLSNQLIDIFGGIEHVTLLSMSAEGNGTHPTRVLIFFGIIKTSKIISIPSRFFFVSDLLHFIPYALY